MTSSLAVVTPWHNHLEYSDGYWDAIEAGAPDDVIVVDNGSNPPLGYPGIRFEENLGFNAACNAGLRAATTDAVLFLNNDIRMTNGDWLDKIRGLLGPGRLVGPLHEGAFHTMLEGRFHPYIDGWCLAGMRDDLIELGGWDTSLHEPAYYGDNLLSLRALEHGLELVNLGFVGLSHITNGTSIDDVHRSRAAAAHNRSVWEQALHRALTTTS